VRGSFDGDRLIMICFYDKIEKGKVRLGKTPGGLEGIWLGGTTENRDRVHLPDV